MAVLALKRVVPLRQVTEADHYNGGEDLGRRGVDMQVFDKDLQADIVDDDAHKDQHEIPEELNPSAQIAVVEHHPTHEKEAQGEGDDEGNNKCHDMR